MTKQWAFLTLGGAGLSPKAPGTVGTLVAIPLGLLIEYYSGVSTLLLAIVALSIMAIKEINQWESEGNMHDDKRIVIDELVGVWLAMALAYQTPLWWQGCVGFIFFRLFDIWKPSIIGRIDRNVHGGQGVVGDDLVAGVFAGICTGGLWTILGKLWLI